MRSLTTLITTAALLLHMTLGCCAHHAHAAEGSGCSHQHGLNAPAVADLHEQHEHDHDDSDNSHENPSAPPCDELQCSFLASGKVSLGQHGCCDDCNVPSYFSIQFLAPQQKQSHAAHNWGLPALPVRTHLALQILLI